MYVDYVNDRGSKSSLCETDPYCIFYTCCVCGQGNTLYAHLHKHTPRNAGARTRQADRDAARAPGPSSGCPGAPTYNATLGYQQTWSVRYLSDHSPTLMWSRCR